MPDLLDTKVKTWSYSRMTDSSLVRVSPSNLDQVMDGGQFLRAVSISMLNKILVPSVGYKEITEIFAPDQSPEVTTVDGYARRVVIGESFSDLRGGVGTGSSTDADTFMLVSLISHSVTDEFTTMNRAIMLFDVSTIPTGSVIQNARMIFRAGTTFGTEFGGNIGLVELLSINSNTAVTTADYPVANYGSADLAPRVELLGTNSAIPWVPSEDNVYQLNEAGLTVLTTAIDGDNIVKFAMRTGYDIDNTSPTWASAKADTVSVRSADHTTNPAPRLYVTYWSSN